MHLQYDFQKDVSAMFEKIRRRVANSTWNDFLKVLMLYVDGIITEQDLMRLVSCVIGTASNDLVQLFDDFMSRYVWPLSVHIALLSGVVAKVHCAIALYYGC